MTRAWLRGDRSQRGAVMVELGIVLPLLLMLAFGIADIGLAWRDKVTVETAVRAGSRTGANLGNNPLTDYNMLQTTLSGLSGIPQANVDEIVVFNADSSGTVPATCKAGSSVAGLCNVYLPSAFNLSSSSFGCHGGPDTSWCPTNRSVSQSAGTDYVGVYLKAHRSSLTKLIASGQVTMSATAVFRIDPTQS